MNVQVSSPNALDPDMGKSGSPTLTFDSILRVLLRSDIFQCPRSSTAAPVYCWFYVLMLTMDWIGTVSPIFILRIRIGRRGLGSLIVSALFSCLRRIREYRSTLNPLIVVVRPAHEKW